MFPVVTMNHQKDCISEINNAMLTELDIENLSPHNINLYLADRIGFHDEWIHANMILHDRIFGELDHPIYTYGKDGYIFFDMKDNQPDTAFIDAFCKHMRKVQDYCEARAVPFIYCLNASKATVYSQYLPEGYIYNNHFLEVFTRKLNEYGIHYISNVELMIEKAKTQQVYNRQYDAGHWNDWGQFYGNNHLLEKVSEYFSDVKPWSLSDFSITTKTETVLPVSDFKINDEVEYFTAVHNGDVETTTAEYEGIYLDPRHCKFESFRKNSGNTGNLPRVLFLHGSYYERNREFYSGAFSETYAVHNYQNLIDFEYYFNIFQPECVLLETTEYATGRDFFDYDRMVSKEFNPPFSEAVKTPHVEMALGSLNISTEEYPRICKISFENDGSYSYGYLKAGDRIFDLNVAGDQITCTFDKTYADLTDAAVYLFQ